MTQQYGRPRRNGTTSPTTPRTSSPAGHVRTDLDTPATTLSVRYAYDSAGPNRTTQQTDDVTRETSDVMHRLVHEDGGGGLASRAGSTSRRTVTVQGKPAPRRGDNRFTGQGAGHAGHQTVAPPPPPPHPLAATDKSVKRAHEHVAGHGVWRFDSAVAVFNPRFPTRVEGLIPSRLVWRDLAVPPAPSCTSWS